MLAWQLGSGISSMADGLGPGHSAVVAAGVVAALVLAASGPDGHVYAAVLGLDHLGLVRGLGEGAAGLPGRAVVVAVDHVGVAEYPVAARAFRVVPRQHEGAVAHLYAVAGREAVRGPVGRLDVGGDVDRLGPGDAVVVAAHHVGIVRANGVGEPDGAGVAVDDDGGVVVCRLLVAGEELQVAPGDAVVGAAPEYEVVGVEVVPPVLASLAEREDGAVGRDGEGRDPECVVAEGARGEDFGLAEHRRVGVHVSLRSEVSAGGAIICHNGVEMLGN